MGVHKLTAGDGYTYLTRQVAAHDSTEMGPAGLGDYYAQKGESPGRWVGSGLAGLDMAAGEPVTAEQMKALFGKGQHPNASVLGDAVIAAGGTQIDALRAGVLGRPFCVYDAAATFRVEVAKEFSAWNTHLGKRWDAGIPAEERARIRTQVGRRMFAAEFGRSPGDARELSGFIARASRHATTAVAGFDLTFSPVKSVSALWAVAAPDVAVQIDQAQDAAVADTIRWLETDAVYTRTGHGGARQVDVRGLVAAAFTHRDARSGDPNLHTHVAVSNKVQTLDGRWLALDGRVLYKANVAASERYNTRLEAELIERLGVRFADRQPYGKRPVREIVGVDERLTQFWSTRRAAIDARRAQLATQFQAHHGRPPTTVEAIALAQQATLETRDAKHEPRSETEQRATWRQKAIEVLGSPEAVEAMVSGVTSLPRQVRKVTPAWTEATAIRVLKELEKARATWQVWHVRAEAERHARAAGVALAELDTAVEEVVAAALSPAMSIPLGTADPIAEPDVLRRRDGSSVYDVAGSRPYTSESIIAAEQQLLATARLRDGHRISDTDVGVALAESAANGTELDAAQAAMVRELATSGARLQVALAPAGTGKTTAMAVLARAWTDAGGDVLGMAPSAQSARELGRAIGGHTDTLAKLTWSIEDGSLPYWVSDIGSRTLVIVDEAGLAGTADLATAVAFVTSRGGSVRLVGDDQQLASVAAGGILRDITETIGAVTLSEVRRFHDPVEAAATLALRDGDPAALGFYADNSRIHVGDQGSVADQAYQAWAADRAAGLDTVLLAPTRDMVAALNERARADRLAVSGDNPGRSVRLADGTQASAGDVVVTRRNERRLATSPSDWVKNGDRWTVHTVHQDGRVGVRHLQTRHRITLPADYVRNHLQLGYATTVHAAEGITADTAHTVAVGNETRQLLYVAMSRGRRSNHVYLATAGDGDSHSIIRPETLQPPTAIDTLTAILGRDGSQHSAATTVRELDSPAYQLHAAVTRYHDSLGVAAEQLIGTDRLAAMDRAMGALIPGVTSQPAYPTLRAHLALAAANGNDPVDLAAAVADTRELGTADDMAAVLDWRIGGAGTDGPLPWLPAVPTALATHPEWAPYLRARDDRVRTLADQLRAEAGDWTPTTAPPWAGRLVDEVHPRLLGELAVWRAALDIPDADHRLTGAPQPAVDAARHQNHLNTRIERDLPEGNHAATLHRDRAVVLDQRIITDPYWPRLADRLSALDRANIDVKGLIQTALAERPLPDQQAAAALWWRLVRHLGPAALQATGRPGSSLRPAWAPILIDTLGHATADRVRADPAWPALVAAIDGARRDGWTPQQLIATALDSVRASDTLLPAGELASALVWRVAVLTDPPPDIETFPPDPADDGTTPSRPPNLFDPPAPAHEGARSAPGSGNHSPDTATTCLTTTPAPRPGSHERILELNRVALAYFIGNYPRSWAPGYLRDRLGTNLTGDDRYTPGYSPGGWTSLIRHLQTYGATDAEIVAAGLGAVTSKGNLIDSFRDRLVFPIYRDEDVVGFIARRNPRKDDDAHAGPKYLNTRSTETFHKGQQLFGLHEAAADLATGAVPVLVEGPLDAIAITISSDGQAVGVSPLGTALTDTQADQLRPNIRANPSGLIVATDPDPAGWKAAQRAYWQLTARGADPQHLPLPPGVDPASLLQQQGPEAIRDTLRRTQPLARTLIETTISQQRGPLDAPATRLRMVKCTGQIIGALPPRHWLDHINRETQRLDLTPGMLHREVIDTGTTRPHQLAQLRIAEIPPPAVVDWPDPRPSPVKPQRWTDPNESIGPHLARNDEGVASEHRYRVIAAARLKPPAPLGANRSRLGQRQTPKIGQPLGPSQSKPKDSPAR